MLALGLTSSMRQDGLMPGRDVPLPTGLVTFLLTDVEGSTQAWQSAPDEMSTIVSRHYQILDAAVVARGGVRPQEQGEGDSIVAVFEDPAEAVRTALDAQLALRRELPDLPVRMALHTGEAMLRNADNYVGLTIIRCARIRSCGHGGQILLSDDTVRATHDSLPDGTDAHDLGLYGLRGLDGRTRVWQLTHPDLPSDFPPLKAGTSAAGNLPTPLTSFIGRRTELATVGDSLGGQRLVTLVGQAGIGKSRLAQAVGDAAANSMTGGVWWIPLAGVDDNPDAVAMATLRACALERDDLTPMAPVVDHFNSVADALVIFDGFDAAPQATAAVVDELLARCADVRILTSGRQPLGLPGELVHPVDPMPVPDDDFDGTIDDLHRFAGTRLFLDRGVNARAGAPFADTDAARIARVCQQLRGVPLGIELAAARSGRTSIMELAESLTELSAADDQGLADTLSTSIAWTYQFLEADAQVALRRLGVFHGDFEVDAAAAVVAGRSLDTHGAMIAIRRLLDEHLLTHDASSGRLGLSREIREFARDRLADDDDLVTTTARHGAWYADVAERFGAGGDDMPDSMLEPDLADLLAALDASMTGDDPAVAYRIVIGVGGRLAALGHPERLDGIATWLSTRSPSDGEDRWSAAIARMATALADRPSHVVHDFVPEARAIAELGGDDDTAERLRAVETARSVSADMAPASPTGQD